ncbi:MAG: hypothetical protein NTY53_00345 [Kiritimatiellaeota bacterium]|nr:hypothetical protein [Kiritimatiellota bacterium]
MEKLTLARSKAWKNQDFIFQALERRREFLKKDFTHEALLRIVPREQTKETRREKQK